VYIGRLDLGLFVYKSRLELQLYPHKRISGYVFVSDRSKIMFGLEQLCQCYVRYRLTQQLHTLLPTQRRGRLSQRSRTHKNVL